MFIWWMDELFEIELAVPGAAGTLYPDGREGQDVNTLIFVASCFFLG